MRTEENMPLEKHTNGDAGTDSGTDYARTQVQIAKVDAKVDALAVDIAEIRKGMVAMLAIVPTASEKRAALAFGGVLTVILAAAAKRYLGVDIPLSDTETMAGAGAAAALVAALVGLRNRKRGAGAS